LLTSSNSIFAKAPPPLSRELTAFEPSPATEQPRREYPRPQLRRERWINLNGVWQFAFDDEDRGRDAGWAGSTAALDREILVPFCPQAPLSGIGDRSFHDVVWYGRTFAAPAHELGERVMVRFGAVDYAAAVWVNGKLVAEHEGGHTPFGADITGALEGETNTVVVRAEDPGADPAVPRGKQDWHEQPSHIFYGRTTGIWQTVWLETVNEVHIESLRLVPKPDEAAIDVGVRLRGRRAGATIRATAELVGRPAGSAATETDGTDATVTIRLVEPAERWSPESPSLYDLTVEVLDADGSRRDLVRSYFGLRTIEIAGGEIRLNGEPRLLRLVLDQGYWPDGLLTAPTDAALRRDIELAKGMGFEGARKHQKIEDPRWLFWADRLGFLVWGEMANAHRLSGESVKRTISEWSEAVARDFNHPSVIAWVPVNESFGCRQIGDDRGSSPIAAHVATALYRHTKELDPTRPALSNDGWEHTESDLCTVHDYGGAAALAGRFASAAALAARADPPLYADGYSYGGEPVVVSEYGGVFRGAPADGLGYQVAADDAQYLKQLAALTRALTASPIVRGFCYTQLTDVEHERNGLLTDDRRPKLPLHRLKAIFGAPGSG
jgi:beta-galactosidase/beta-glucuronidase